MLSLFRFASVAESELSEAIAYYEIEANQGLDFAREVQRVVDHAMTFPSAGTLVAIDGVTRPVRRFRLNPAYPYDVVAMIVEDQDLLLVLAVAHHKREPSYWLDRL